MSHQRREAFRLWSRNRVPHPDSAQQRSRTARAGVVSSPTADHAIVANARDRAAPAAACHRIPESVAQSRNRDIASSRSSFTGPRSKSLMPGPDAALISSVRTTLRWCAAMATTRSAEAGSTRARSTTAASSVPEMSASSVSRFTIPSTLDRRLGSGPSCRHRAEFANAMQSAAREPGSTTAALVNRAPRGRRPGVWPPNGSDGSSAAVCWDKCRLQRYDAAPRQGDLV